MEPGHIIDPEILIRGLVEDRPGTPKRLAMIVWLVDTKTGARLSGDVSSVTLATASSPARSGWPSSSCAI